MRNYEPRAKALGNVYYIYKDRKNIFKMNKEVGMLLPKKELIQVE